MIGQYTEEELLNMPGIISSVYQLNKGIVIRRIGNTVNYYSKCSDGSWLNYDCKTK